MKQLGRFAPHPPVHRVELVERNQVPLRAELAEDLRAAALPPLFDHLGNGVRSEHADRAHGAVCGAVTLEAYIAPIQHVVRIAEDAMQDALGRETFAQHRRRMWQRFNLVLDACSIRVRNTGQELHEITTRGSNAAIRVHEYTNADCGWNLLA